MKPIKFDKWKLEEKGKFGINSNKNPLRFTEKLLYANEFECLLLKRTLWASFKSSRKASELRKPDIKTHHNPSKSE